MTLRTVLVAATTLTAGLIHLAAGPAHAASPAWYWGGFVLVGVAQVAAAVLALVRGRLAPALVVNLGAIGVWVVSTTIGLPGGVGGHAIGLADGITVGLQAVALLGAAIPAGVVSAGRPHLLTVAPVMLLALGLGAVGIVDLQSHGHGHDHVHAADDDHVHGSSDGHDHATADVRPGVSGPDAREGAGAAGRVHGDEGDGHHEDGHADEGHHDDGHAH